MRAVSIRIRQIDAQDLPSVIRFFIDPIPFVCGDMITDEGHLKVEDIASAILAISAMEREFWERNPYIQPLIVGNFPRLYAWVMIVGEMLVRNRDPI